MKPKPWLTAEVIQAAQEAGSASVPDEASQRTLLLHFLEILDSIDRMRVLSRSKQLTTAGWDRQMDALHTQVLQALEAAGVVFEDSLGKSFDPARHEAVGRIERDDIPDYTIAEVIERGCEWSGRILRTARVIVSSHSKEASLDQEENTT